MRLHALIAEAGGSVRIDERGQLVLACPPELREELKASRTELLREAQAVRRAGGEALWIVKAHVLLNRLERKGYQGAAIQEVRAGLGKLFDALALSDSEYERAKKLLRKRITEATFHLWVLATHPGQPFEECSLAGEQLHQAILLKWGMDRHCELRAQTTRDLGAFA